MPYKSLSQARYMNAAAARGDVPQRVASEFNAASKGRMGDLPEHVQRKAMGGPIHDCPSCQCGDDDAYEGSAVPAPHAAQQDENDSDSFHMRWKRARRSR